MRLLTRDEADKIKLLYRKYLSKNRSKWEETPAKRRERLKAKAGKGWRPSEWDALVALYRNLCLKCRKKFRKLTADHVIPLVRGGRHHISNIQPLCRRCNASKGVKIIDFRITVGLEIIDGLYD